MASLGSDDPIEALAAHAAASDAMSLLHEHIPEPTLSEDPEELMAQAHAQGEVSPIWARRTRAWISHDVGTGSRGHGEHLSMDETPGSTACAAERRLDSKIVRLLTTLGTRAARRNNER